MRMARMMSKEEALFSVQPRLNLEQLYGCKVLSVSFQGCSIGCDYCLTDPMHPANNGSIPTKVSVGSSFVSVKMFVRRYL